MAGRDTYKNGSGFNAPRSWALLSARKRVVALVLVVDAAAALLSLAAWLGSSTTASDLLRFGLLAIMSVVYLELTRQVERRRRLFVAPDSPHTDVTSVWLLAGAMVLPAGLAAALAALVFGHIWLRSWRQVDSVQPHRVLYSAASVILGCIAVSTMLHATRWGHEFQGTAAQLVAAAAAAIVLYRVVNRLLITAAITLSAGVHSRSALFGSVAENALEFSTLVLGAMTAVLVVRVPPLAVLVLPAVFLLQHRALLKQLVEAATIDTKTELLNAGAWRQLAQRELERAGRAQTSTAVLVIDMDHFKRLNDTYGHLAGDEALKAVGEALADELRGYDAVGRFGGEEFVALLPAVDAPAAVTVAERIRRRIESLDVTVEPRAGGIARAELTASVGIAAARGAQPLDELLRAADAALYAAKDAGRNTVHCAQGRLSTAA